MKVFVVGFGAVREFLRNPVSGQDVVDLPDGSTVRDLVAVLRAPESLMHTVLVDGRHAQLTHELVDGSEVTLMPPFAGGSS